MVVFRGYVKLQAGVSLFHSLRSTSSYQSCCTSLWVWSVHGIWNWLWWIHKVSMSWTWPSLVPWQSNQTFCWWFRNPARKTTWDAAKALLNTGLRAKKQLIINCWAGFSEPSTVTTPRKTNMTGWKKSIHEIQNWVIFPACQARIFVFQTRPGRWIYIFRSDDHCARLRWGSSSSSSSNNSSSNSTSSSFWDIYVFFFFRGFSWISGSLGEGIEGQILWRCVFFGGVTK